MAVVGGDVSNGDTLEGIFPAGSADVYPEVFKLELGAAFLTAHHVDGLAAYDAAHEIAIMIDVHSEAGQEVDVEAAQGLDIHIALFVDMIDDKADFVRMAHHHYFQLAAAVLDGDQIAVDVRANLIGIGSHEGAGYLLGGSFESGWAGSGDEVFKELEVFFFHPVLSAVVGSAGGKGVEGLFYHRFLMRNDAQESQSVLTGVVK